MEKIKLIYNRIRKFVKFCCFNYEKIIINDRHHHGLLVDEIIGKKMASNLCSIFLFCDLCSIESPEMRRNSLNQFVYRAYEHSD